jgi:hypothetical protein
MEIVETGHGCSHILLCVSSDSVDNFTSSQPKRLSVAIAPATLYTWTAVFAKGVSNTVAPIFTRTLEIAFPTPLLTCFSGLRDAKSGLSFSLFSECSLSICTASSMTSMVFCSPVPILRTQNRLPVFQYFLASPNATSEGLLRLRPPSIYQPPELGTSTYAGLK